MGPDNALGNHPLGDKRGTVFCHVTDILTVVTLGPIGGVRAIPRDVAGAVARVTQQLGRAILGHVTNLRAFEALDFWRWRK